jgi:signal recognition particle subunit SRP54
MFDALSDKLQQVFGRLSSHGTVTEKDLDEALREVRVAPLPKRTSMRPCARYVSPCSKRT